MSDLACALKVAFRHITDATTTEREAEAILASLAEHFDGEVGETAARSLFHLRERRKEQLTLGALLEGIGKHA